MPFSGHQIASLIPATRRISSASKIQYYAGECHFPLFVAN